MTQFACEMFNLGEPVYERLKEGEVSESIEGRRRLPAELKQMILDPKKAENYLKWSPQIGLKDGIMATFDWLRSHADRWSRMRY